MSCSPRSGGVFIALACTLAMVACVATPSTSPKRSASSSASSSGTPSVATTSPATGDTGASSTATALACPADVGPLSIEVCVETTAPRGYTDTGGSGTVHTFWWTAFEGSGTVTAVGGVLPAIPDSAPMEGFSSCGPEHVNQVRLLDDDGAIWTFGWDAAWTTTDAATVTPSTALEFAISLDYWIFGAALSFVLSDAVGPVVLFELPGQLDTAGRFGITVETHLDDYCLAEDERWGGMVEHSRMSLTWPGASADLRSGQSATIELPGRDLEATVPWAYNFPDCLDGCSGYSWAAWETP
jgi:hypothetical protein